MAADPGEIIELESPQATFIAIEESVLSEEEPMGPLQVLYSMIDCAMHYIMQHACVSLSYASALICDRVKWTHTCTSC